MLHLPVSVLWLCECLDQCSNVWRKNCCLFAYESSSTLRFSPVQFNESGSNPIVMLGANTSRLAFFFQANPEVSDFIRSRPAGGDITRFDKWWIPEGSPPVSQQTENSSQLTWRMLSSPHTSFDPRKDGQPALLLFFLYLF